MPIAISDDSGSFGEGGEDAPTERATGATFLATSTRSMPALATTFAARVVRLVLRAARATGALTAERRETWATAIVLFWW